MTQDTPTPPPDYVHPKTAEETGFFYPNGEPVPPTHPDHGPMDQLPRMEDGGFAAYYYCSTTELKAGGIADATPPRRHRKDGWTLDRIERFLEALRSTASVTDACRTVSMSPRSAYDLYNRKGNDHIRKAWDEALRAATNILATTAFDRAVNGTEYKVFHKGEFVGWQVRHDNRHLQWMLRARDPLNWAPLDELQGWLRHREIAKHEDAEDSLERLAKGEEEWERRLPGEKGAPDERILPAPEAEGEIGETADRLPGRAEAQPTPRS
jgi:hypothetical protein